MIRVFVVDDHPIVVDGVSAVLEAEPGMEIAGTAGSAEELFSKLPRARPDVVLVDLGLPGIGGIEAIARLTRSAAKPRIVVFSAYEDDEAVVSAMRAGANGYIVKGAPAAEIVRGIREVARGGTYLTGSAAAAVAAELRAPRTGQLTQREREVLRLVADGLSNKRIAASLGITERTAKYHLRQIMNKLNADNRAQAVVLASRRRLL